MQDQESEPTVSTTCSIILFTNRNVAEDQPHTNEILVVPQTLTLPCAANSRMPAENLQLDVHSLEGRKSDALGADRCRPGSFTALETTK